MAGAGDLVEHLRAAFGRVATTSGLATPVSHARLVEMIVRTAAQVIGARGGSLLLIDEATQELVFEVTADGDVTDLKKIRVPLGEGVAGLVALTGQPLAIADAQSDPRHAADIAERTGFLPTSLLCVPLQYTDEVIGVLELLDKQGAEGFSSSDMHTLGLFARMAAISVEQSRSQQSVAGLLRELVSGLADSGPDLAQRTSDFAATLESDAVFRRAVELGQLVYEIAQQGEDESRACLAILRGFAEYSRRQQRLSAGLAL